VKRWRIVVLGAIGALGATLLWARFGYLFEGGLKAELESAARNGAHTTIDLDHLATFSWDRVVPVGPYNEQQMVDSALGFKWPDYQRFGMEKNDTSNLLVFALGRSVVRVQELPRCVPDLAHDIQSVAISRPNAIFKITDGNGCATLALVKGLRPNLSLNRTLSGVRPSAHAGSAG
jgi:hypothetical protein